MKVKVEWEVDVEREREKIEYLLDLVPDNKIEFVTNYLEGIVELPKEEDPFYSEENQARLKQAMDRLEAGQGTPHELIEVI